MKTLIQSGNRKRNGIPPDNFYHKEAGMGNIGFRMKSKRIFRTRKSALPFFGTSVTGGSSFLLYGLQIIIFLMIIKLIMD